MINLNNIMKLDKAIIGVCGEGGGWLSTAIIAWDYTYFSIMILGEMQL